MVGVLALVLITNITNLLTYPITRTSINNVTITSCFTSLPVQISTTLIAILMRIYIPFLLMIGLNFIVIIRLRNSKRRVGINGRKNNNAQQQLPSTQPANQLSRKEYKFVVTTIIIDAMFFVLHTPLAAFFVITIYNQFNDSITSQPVVSAWVNLFSNVSQLMAVAYPELMIFIFVTLNRYFREELLVIFRLSKRPTVGNQNESFLGATRTNMRTDMDMS